jgi:hypothetical protein
VDWELFSIEKQRREGEEDWVEVVRNGKKDKIDEDILNKDIIIGGKKIMTRTWKTP